MKENINPQEIEANTMIQYLGEFDKNGYRLEGTAEQLIKKMNEFMKIMETIKNNTFLKEKLSEKLDEFIEKNWDATELEEGIKSNDDETNQRNLLKRILFSEECLKKENNVLTRSQHIINNMPILFLRSHTGADENPHMHESILKEDFKGLNIEKYDKAMMCMHGYYKALARKNFPKIYDELDNEKIKNDFNALIKRLDSSGVNEIFLNLFERLVIEKGYDPKLLAS